jgi:hypothetical protein
MVISIMKITTVLTAVNNNPKYTRFIPLFISRWKALYPDILVKIVFIGNSIPPEFSTYSEHFILFPEIDGISSVYIAQTIRILYPALLGEGETVAITDMDMLPGNQTYFVDAISHIESNTFVSMRPLHIVGSDQLAICYGVAAAPLWSRIFKIQSVEDVKTFLINNYKHADGIHGGEGWLQDQILLRRYVSNSKCNFVPLDDHYYKRLDWKHHNYEKPTFIKLLSSESFSDIHLYGDMCPWILKDIYEIITLI